MARVTRIEARLTEQRMTHVHSDLLMAGECLRREYLLSLHSGWSLNLVSRSRAPLKLVTATRASLLLTGWMSEQANLEYKISTVFQLGKYQCTS